MIMDEFSFIESIQQKAYHQSSVIKGIGDDAAVFRETARDIVTALDVFVEDVHFTRETMSPFHVGYRALAANLSDMAAMGAVPTSILVGTVIPGSWSPSELEDLFSGIRFLAKQYQVDLIGGDTVSGEKLTLSITIMGAVARGKARYRSTAKPGDVVFVTGTLGDSQAGLHLLMNESGQVLKDEKYFIEKHRMPTPRVDFSKALSPISRLSLNDISDGIANEAREIAEASQMTIYLYDEAIPVSRSFNQFPKSLQNQWKFFGGEDFELMGTVSEKEWPLVEKIASETRTQVTKVGYVTLNRTNASDVFLIKTNQEEVILKKEGYTHLK